MKRDVIPWQCCIIVQMFIDHEGHPCVDRNRPDLNWLSPIKNETPLVRRHPWRRGSRELTVASPALQQAHPRQAEDSGVAKMYGCLTRESSLESQVPDSAQA